MNKAPSKKVPDLRFSEFQREWEEKPLGDVLIESRIKGDGGDVAKKLTVKLWGKGVFEKKEVTLGSEHTQYFVRRAGQFIYSKLDFLNCAFGIIPESLDRFQSTVDLPCFDISPNANPVFILEAVRQRRFYKRFGDRADGSRKAKRIHANVFCSFCLNSPELSEQKKIATFLSAVDGRIEGLEKKRDLLKEYKKGLMQKLFNQTLRFSDDDGQPFPDWEEKRLGTVATFSKGKGLPKDDISEDGQTECIRYGELYTHYNELISVVRSKTNVDASELVLSEENDVIIPASGETQIDIATASCIQRTGIAIGGDLNIIRTPNDGMFLAYYLNNQLKHDIARLAQGVSVIHLYPTHLKTLKLSLPCLGEQQKIADCLSAVDRRIGEVEAQVSQTRTFKQGLLQKMFV